MSSRTIRSRYPVWRYLFRKVFIYVVTFVVAVSIDWAIPRFMPGDPIEGLLSRMQAQPQASEELTSYTEAFGFDVTSTSGLLFPRRSRAQHHELPDPCH